MNQSQTQPISQEEIDALLDWSLDEYEGVISYINSPTATLAEAKRRMTVYHNGIRKRLRTGERRLTRAASLGRTLSLHRPPSVYADVEVRQQLGRVLDVIALEPPSREVGRAMLKITTELATAIIDKYSQRGESNIGCRLSTLTKNERYSSIDLSKTAYRVPDTNIKFPSGKYYLHHIAILQDPIQRHRLKAVFNTATSTVGNRYQVSHRCHQSHCINLEHLVIESAEDNLKRNSCQSQQIAVVKQGNRRLILHPCPHRALTKVKKECILHNVPVKFPAHGQDYVYYNNPSGPHIESAAIHDIDL